MKTLLFCLVLFGSISSYASNKCIVIIEEAWGKKTDSRYSGLITEVETQNACNELASKEVDDHRASLADERKAVNVSATSKFIQSETVHSIFNSSLVIDREENIDFVSEIGPVVRELSEQEIIILKKFLD